MAPVCISSGLFIFVLKVKWVVGQVLGRRDAVGSGAGACVNGVGGGYTDDWARSLLHRPSTGYAPLTEQVSEGFDCLGICECAESGTV